MAVSVPHMLHKQKQKNIYILDRVAPTPFIHRLHRSAQSGRGTAWRFWPPLWCQRPEREKKARMPRLPRREEEGRGGAVGWDRVRGARGEG